MLKIDPTIVRRLRSCKAKEELHEFLQKAIELEHATIPPYLTAMYSLVPGKNEEIRKLIRSVVIEEMLHMTISANILVAIGGQPKINHPDFIPKYPGKLPMGIGDGLVVPIKAFSRELVKDVFMMIEEPEDPIPIRTAMLAADAPEFNTIGEFYAALQEKICELGDEIFVVGPEKQVLSWFDEKDTIPIVSADSAVKAIQLIVEEGEGTSTSPFVEDSWRRTCCDDIEREKHRLPGEGKPLNKDDEGYGEVAHYYLFEEIYEGRKIVPDGHGGYSFSGDPIPFDQAGVYPMIDNPSPEDYEPGSYAATLSATFSYGYSNLLNSLHEAFNGNPSAIDSAVGLMYQLRLNAQKLMSTPISPDSPRTAGPVFRYVTTNPAPVAKPAKKPPIFPTFGVHNPPEYSHCAYPDCIYPRGPGEPSDPIYPVYWSAKWTMYRVFGENYAAYLPPYDGKPPAGLVEGKDYEVSYGETYYDSTFVCPNGQTGGAMMEFYKDRSLPIFPMDNKYTSAFISLGNDAYYLTWDDRPEGMPPISHFSDLNHPPRRDFIKHLPYSKGDSQQLGGKIQGYSLWTAPRGDDKPPVQTGVSPDLTKQGSIMFGYAFESEWRPDSSDPDHESYRHPQSFYFSGFPGPLTKGGPLFAPMVSQYYTEFAAVRPDPAKTWDLVAKFAGGKPIPIYNPFDPKPGTSPLQAEPGGGQPKWSGKPH